MNGSANALSARFRHRYPAFSLDVDVRLPMRGVTALFGPSGSGKTTLLRLIAGLEKAADGQLTVGDAVWQDAGTFMPPHERPLGYVFQDARLFPHLDVRRNLEYGLQRIPAAARQVSLDEVVELLGIGPLMQRKPERLSGGERQRVAIARALAVSPRLLLLDEPLAALDQARKQEVLPYLERLHDSLEIPVLYVSHAIEEVARLADHLLLLEAGQVVAAGAPAELMARVDLPLAQGNEAGALIEATVSGHDEAYQLTEVTFSGGRLSLARQAAAIGQRVRVRVLARDVSLTLAPQTGTSIINILPARVVSIATTSPGQSVIGLDLGGTAVLARVTHKSVAALGLKPGLDVHAQIKGVAILK
ncbi:MAG: molybdenum ABC transporter ATP-binding protein [Gammaproteobacteria bacterium]|nr:molybdenum ABC transporter ATP-binding protein [Rhodocyclaceae bacterium]MBU3909675.1 molybdenum ABC transporter ATP-binding protein [Gammaproteobacteria bacterium]MBU3988025.1 molybdenum ABC transporter ATP-binding protein [Gammaproteobacteria bacterium]MBU4005208.1 molybdenum ABC transporter ATP-binding protein [Gammaproteobacteria bacterium]MBU4022387.1 molybdenum ABC transporter ATP-binding protein [Gammaproteobacteria bacterium]